MAKTAEHEGWKSVNLFYDGERYKDDVYVNVNGKSYLIKRGMEVEVPPEVYEVLMHAQEQAGEAKKLMTSLKQK